MMMMMISTSLLIIYYSISLLLVISSPLDSLNSIDNGSSSSNSDHNYQQSATGIRGAIIITLAGDHKLAQYFEWTCRTITYSSLYYDMLVFHESNSKVVTLNCANNVKLIDIGKNGLSRLIVNKILENDMFTSADTKNTLIKLLELILLHMPRYLVEIKPVLGSIFKDYLTNYSHWSYSDPDIVWGNLVDWMDIHDLVDYEIVTVAKNMDAARLFLRGQLAFHQNNDKINHLWRRLEYFKPSTFAARLGNAARMIEGRQSSDAIFMNCFYSSEGYYSQLVFKENISVKIVGRGFDDFSTSPVVVYQGRMMRCNANIDLSTCLNITKSVDHHNNISPGSRTGDGDTVRAHKQPSSSSAAALVPVNAYYNTEACMMFWLPKETRYCILEPKYEKGDRNPHQLLNIDSDKMRLMKVSESIYTNGNWLIKSEDGEGLEEVSSSSSSSSRGLYSEAAFFHFRHWDDFLSRSVSTNYNNKIISSLYSENKIENALNNCMVLYIRYDKALSFEDCSIVQRKLLTNSKLVFEIPRHVKRIKSMKDMSKYKNKLSNRNQDIYRQKKIEMEKSRNGRKKSAPIN